MSSTDQSPREIQLHNSLTGKKERFAPLEAGTAKIYSCGPTVYGFTHVGNAKTAITLDLMGRIFRYAGYQTKIAANITDVDDRIIKVANETGQSTIQVAQHFTDTYLDEIKTLLNRSVDERPKATESISEIVSMVEALIKKGLAYASDTPFGKDVYFSVSAFKNYGKLSHRHIEDMKVGTRIEAGESKKDPLDFALWKAAKVNEPSWESPWGQGRPGWHIECSAMIEKVFHGPIDIHHGGIDLIFPHHENEIAQTEGLKDHALATYWVHNGLLNFGREKMSKSLGNIFTTHKFLDLYGPEVFRLMIFQHHYKGPMDFSVESILSAEHLLERLYTCKAKALESKNASSAEWPQELKDLAKQMDEALFDDFNSAKALGSALKAARLCFRENKASFWSAWGQSLHVFNEVFGILAAEPAQALAELHQRKLRRLGVTEERSRSIETRLQERESARKNKEYAKSDEIRAKLEADGILVMDGPDGVSWSLKEELAT